MKVYGRVIIGKLESCSTGQFDNDDAAQEEGENARRDICGKNRFRKLTGENQGSVYHFK